MEGENMQTALTQEMKDETPESARQSIVGLASACRVKYGQGVWSYFLDLVIKHTISFTVRPPLYG